MSVTIGDFAEVPVPGGGQYVDAEAIARRLRRPQAPGIGAERGVAGGPVVVAVMTTLADSVTFPSTVRVDTYRVAG